MTIQLSGEITSVALALGEQAVHTELRLRALEELLIKKEIVTAEELKESYAIVSDRDFDKLKFGLAESIREYIEQYYEEEEED